MVNKKQKNKHWGDLFCWLEDEGAVATASVYCNQNLYVDDYDVDEEGNENKLGENEYMLISRLYYEPEEEKIQEKKEEIIQEEKEEIIQEENKSEFASDLKQSEEVVEKSNDEEKNKEENEEEEDVWKPDPWDFTGRSKEEIEEEEERERREIEELRRNTKLKRIERRVYKNHIDYVYIIDGPITSCMYCGSELYGAAIEYEDDPSDNSYGLYCNTCRQFTIHQKKKLEKEWMNVDHQIYEIVPKYIETNSSSLENNDSKEEEDVIFTGTAMEIFHYLNSGKYDKNSFQILPYYPYEI